MWPAHWPFCSCSALWFPLIFIPYSLPDCKDIKGLGTEAPCSHNSQPGEMLNLRFTREKPVPPFGAKFEASFIKILNTDQDGL